MRSPRFWPAVALAAAMAGSVRPVEVPGPPTRQWVAELFAAWKAPVPPRHLVGNVYYVGALGVSSYLITTPQGHFLLDTGFEDTVPIILRGVEQLGFKATDIKLILSSHAHVDHVGGHAAMKRATGGARVVASAGDARVLESGGTDDYIQFPRDTIGYAPVKVDTVVADREVVSLGGVNLTAHLTPGHTRGATTWTMQVQEGGRTYDVVFFSSATVNDGTRLVGNPLFPEIAAAYESAFARLETLPCDIFLAPHAGQFAMAEKFAKLDRGEGVAALVDPAGWKKLLGDAAQAFRDRLAAEQAQANK